MAIEQNIAVLKQLEFFSFMTKEQLRLLLFSAEELDISRGKTLFREGDKADCAYIVLTGSFNLFRRQGHIDRAIDMVTKGILLSELALITEISRPMTAVAALDSTVLKLNRTTFLRLMDEFPEIAYQIYDYVSDRMRDLVKDIGRFSDLS